MIKTYNLYRLDTKDGRDCYKISEILGECSRHEIFGGGFTLSSWTKYETTLKDATDFQWFWDLPLKGSKIAYSSSNLQDVLDYIDELLPIQELRK